MYKDENIADIEKRGYQFPQIQYRVINGMLTIIGIDEGADFVAEEFIKVDEFKINKQVIRGFETKLLITDEELGIGNSLCKYRFVTPWVCINQKNHQAYLTGKLDLNKVLRNNIVANLKSLNTEFQQEIIVQGNFQPVIVNIKDAEMVGFYGEFVTNVKLPEFIGIGKRKSIGYGGIEKV